MSLIDGLRHRLYVLVRREAYARDVECELRFHVDLDVLARASDTPNALDAERAARRRLGNATYYREEVRRMTLLSWLDRVRQDLLYALRGLRRSPGFATTVIVTLALGFGVNAATYEMLDAVFRRPPAGVVDPGGVRRVYEDLSRPKEPGGRLMFGGFTYPHFRAVATAAEPVPLAGFTTPDSVNLGDGDRRLATRASNVTGEYFRILGLRPELGRFFTGEEDSIAVQTPVAVISDGLWRSAFNADSSIPGRSIRVDRKPITVVGVAPPDFTGIDLDAVGLWLPANMIEPSSGYLGNGAPIPWYESFGGSLQLLTRLQTPSDEARLVTTGTVAIRSVHIPHFEYDSTSRFFVGPIVEASGPMKRAQAVLVATRISWIALIVLLISAANVTALLLLRAAGRAREIAVRRALGVSYARLCLQLAVESLVLALLGGACAVAVAFWTGTARNASADVATGALGIRPG